MNYEKIVRRLRSNNSKIWDENDTIANKASRVLGKAKAKMMEQRKQEEMKRPKVVGPYSGLTREELAKTGTCEPDWY